MKKHARLLFGIACLLLLGCVGTAPKLGHSNGQLQPCPAKPNCVSSLSGSEEHSIEPLVIEGSLKVAKQQLVDTINTLNRAQLTEGEGNYLRAEFVSRIFRFVDDVEFMLVESGQDMTTIHVRSASRVGHSDLGVNRSRIEKIRASLAEAD